MNSVFRQDDGLVRLHFQKSLPNTMFPWIALAIGYSKGSSILVGKRGRVIGVVGRQKALETLIRGIYYEHPVQQKKQLQAFREALT